MDENTRSTDTVPTPVHDGQGQETLYVTAEQLEIWEKAADDLLTFGVSVIVCDKVGKAVSVLPPFVYKSKPKGAPGFSGRSTRTIHAANARQRSGGKVGQQKQIRG